MDKNKEYYEGLDKRCKEYRDWKNSKVEDTIICNFPDPRENDELTEDELKWLREKEKQMNSVTRPYPEPYELKQRQILLDRIKE